MNSRQKIRIVLVDDHFVVRMGLATSLALEPDIEIVAECDSGERAIDVHREKRPDLIIMDGQLPAMSGAAATAAIRAEFPSARIIMLSVHSGEADILRAVQAGVCAYIHKGARRELIIEAIRTVAGGKDFFPDPIAARLAAGRNRQPLTEREQEILEMIVEGYSNKEIADRLGVADPTVKFHVGHILEKLGVQDRTQAATVAIKRGLVHLE